MFTIIIPTFNEIENLERFVNALLAVFDSNGLDGRIMVVDDSSPDGTGEIADLMAARLPNFSVLHRTHKEGIGPAYIAGFRTALKTDTGFIMEMDCDFSHDPANVPRMLQAIETADLVLGSRYVAGGQVKDWGLLRRLISRGGGLYARRILGVAV
ncbi:MAG: glycosyltransferase, partial [Thermoleophilia bacterium]